MADQTKKRLTGLRRNQQFLYIGIFTLVAVIVWVAGSLFQSQKKTGISSELQKMAIPLNPNINSQVIDRIESKTTFAPEELGSFEIYRVRIEEENRARANQPAPDDSEADSGGSLSDVIAEPTAEPSPESNLEQSPEQSDEETPSPSPESELP